jgi:hypothetical protein
LSAKRIGDCILWDDPRVEVEGDGSAEALLGESRWPPVVAVLIFLALNVAVRVWLPGHAAIRVPWLLPTIEIVLLVVLLTHDLSGADDRRRMHRIALVLAGALVLAALWATVLLVADLIRGKGVTNSPDELLASGAIVWLGNNLAVGLLHGLIDGGGPVSRLSQRVPLDFAFTQQPSPEIAPPGWRPVFLDYLHLGFTNATAVNAFK